MYLYIHNDIYIYCNLQYYNWIYIQYTGIYIYMERERGKKRETDIIGNVYIYIYTHTYIYNIHIYICILITKLWDVSSDISGECHGITNKPE